MEEIAVSGKSPSGVGQALSPLPPEAWQRIVAPLERIRRECESLAESLSPVELHEHRRKAALRKTLTWLSVMVGRIEEALEELRPEVMERRFGPLAGERRKELAIGARRALEALGDARRALREISPPVSNARTDKDRGG